MFLLKRSPEKTPGKPWNTINHKLELSWINNNNNNKICSWLCLVELEQQFAGCQSAYSQVDSWKDSDGEPLKFCFLVCWGSCCLLKPTKLNSFSNFYLCSHLWCFVVLMVFGPNLTKTSRGFLFDAWIFEDNPLPLLPKQLRTINIPTGYLPSWYTIFWGFPPHWGGSFSSNNPSKLLIRCIFFSARIQGGKYGLAKLSQLMSPCSFGATVD